MSKTSSKLKDKIDGDTLDLSLDSLTTVPVKEIATLKKIRSLDLSCNSITVLHDDFCTLTHLVKLDLSKNGLQLLPVDFGELSELQHLDLLGNRLNTLPISMYKMKKLKWLDLKDNSFEDSWKSVTGDCLNEKQCKQCAKDVVSYLESVMKHEEEQQAKFEKQMAEREAEEREAAQLEREQRRQEKAAEKLRRRKLWEERQNELKQAAGDYAEESSRDSSDSCSDNGARVVDSDEPSRGWGCCTKLVCWMLPMLLCLLVTVISVVWLHDFCERWPKDEVCRSTRHVVEPLHHQIMHLYKKVKIPNRVFAN